MYGGVHLNILERVKDLTAVNIFETRSSHKRGTLGTFSGVFAEIDVPNRNGRVYSRAVWESALKSDLVMEKLSTMTFFGELDHPKPGPDNDPSEINSDRICINVTSVWIEGNKVMGEADILDTPAGKLVWVLMKYGSRLGISSRAKGALESYPSDPNLSSVIADTYQLFAFDVVILPSVKSARPSNISLAESYKKEESLVMRAFNAYRKENRDSKSCMNLLESVQDNLGISDSLNENTTKEDSSMDKTVDLDELYSLKMENIALKDQVSKLKVQGLSFTTAELSEAIVSTEESEVLEEEIAINSDAIGKLLEKKIVALRKVIKSLDEKYSKAQTSAINDLTEKENLSKTLKSYKKRYEALSEKVKLQEKIKDSEINKLTENLKVLSEQYDEKNEEIAGLNSILNRTQNELTEAKQSIETDTKHVSEVQDEILQLKESMKNYFRGKLENMGAAKNLLEKIDGADTLKELQKIEESYRKNALKKTSTDAVLNAQGKRSQDKDPWAKAITATFKHLSK